LALDNELSRAIRGHGEKADFRRPRKAFSLCFVEVGKALGFPRTTRPNTDPITDVRDTDIVWVV
jgi:hypothetical protein